MNKNEKKQFEKFESFIKQGTNDKNDIFYGSIKAYQNEDKGYDAFVEFRDGSTKYIQLTTMSNTIIKKNNKVQHADKYPRTLKSNFTNKIIQGDINYLSKIGVKRKIVEYKESVLHVQDELKSIFPNEEDFDKKYGINSANLTNALYRSLMKKLTKYNKKDKKKESVLVIIDESPNVFYNYNITDFNIKNYFNYILKIGIIESKFEHIFFDKVQVYFRQSKSNVSEEGYYYSNTNLCSSIYLKNNIGMKQISAISMNNEGLMLLKTSINKI